MEEFKSNPRHGVPLWIQILIWALLLGPLTLLGFGLVRTRQGTVQPRDQVPDFSLTLYSDYEYNGQSAVKISDLRGKMVFLGMDYVDTEIPARAFLKKFNNTFPNGPDMRTAISQMFRIKGVPETYIIDANGILNYVKIGSFLNADEIKTIIDPLLQ